MALPDHEWDPTHVFEQRDVSGVALHVGLEFLVPESLACGWGCCKSAAPVPMPKASVNEYCDFDGPEDDVWPPRQVRCVKLEPESNRMQIAAHGHFGGRIPSSDAGHHLGPHCLRNDVSH